MTETIIISDTSCLIALDKIGKLDLLHQLFNNVHITRTVEQEFSGLLPNWIIIKDVNDLGKIKELETYVDKGEASAIALALETKNCLLIIDEKKGRQIAKKYRVSIAGTLQIILWAKLKGIIPSAKNILEELEATNFWLSPKLKQEILKLASEL